MGRDLSDAEDIGRRQRDGSRGSIFIRYRGHRNGSRGIISDMISVLHQSVSINAKGGDC
jgi:hypothetical protein